LALSALLASQHLTLLMQICRAMLLHPVVLMRPTAERQQSIQNLCSISSQPYSPIMTMVAYHCWISSNSRQQCHLQMLQESPQMLQESPQMLQGRPQMPISSPTVHHSSKQKKPALTISMLLSFNQRICHPYISNHNDVSSSGSCYSLSNLMMHSQVVRLKPHLTLSSNSRLAVSIGLIAGPEQSRYQQNLQIREADQLQCLPLP